MADNEKKIAKLFPRLGEVPAEHEIGHYEDGDRYLIERAAGRGGMGTVYRATDEHSGLPVALKVVDAPSEVLEPAGHGVEGTSHIDLDARPGRRVVGSHDDTFGDPAGGKRAECADQPDESRADESSQRGLHSSIVRRDGPRRQGRRVRAARTLLHGGPYAA